MLSTMGEVMLVLLYPAGVPVATCASHSGNAPDAGETNDANAQTERKKTKEVSQEDCRMRFCLSKSSQWFDRAIPLLRCIDPVDLAIHVESVTFDRRISCPPLNRYGRPSEPIQ